MKAVDLMTTDVVTAREGMLLTEVVELLLSKGISGLPVTDDERKLVGIISEIDLVNLTFSGNAGDTTVGEVMTKHVIALRPDSDMGELVECFSRGRLRRVPILEKGKLVGIVSRRDILRQMLKQYNGS